HLETNGRLAIAVFHPSAERLVAGANEYLNGEVPFGDGWIRCFDSTVDDRVEQTRVVTRRLEFLRADGTVAEERRYTFDMRYVFKPEMELLLRVAGFARWEMRPMLEGYRNPLDVATVA